MLRSRCLYSAYTTAAVSLAHSAEELLELTVCEGRCPQLQFSPRLVVGVEWAPVLEHQHADGLSIYRPALCIGQQQKGAFKFHLALALALPFYAKI